MDEDEYFDDPLAYVVAFISLFGIYIVIIFAIYAWRRFRPTRPEEDRQGNVFTIHDETNRENRYNDIFFIEPNSVEAARIRAQLEKDEKDLPSYEEVMRMANLSSPTAAPAPAPAPRPAASGAVSVTASSSSVNTTETTLTVPEYTEIDLSATSGPVTPPPYSPPTAAVTNNLLHTQHISSSNV